MASHSLTARQVLIVDADADIRVLVMMRVRQLGWPVRGAATGGQALAIAREQAPALAVIDVGLPDMSGWDVVTPLREDRHTAEVPIVVLSSEDPPPSWPTEDVAAYLIKPFRAADLQEAVTTILGQPQVASRRRVVF